MTTIFKNGRILAGAEDEWDANAHLCLTVTGDLIQYIGPNDHQVLSSAGEQPTHTVDLRGRMVVPGFIDGHMHLLLFGSALQKIDLAECNNLDDIKRTIRVSAQARPHAPRILCRGWMHSMTNGLALANMLDDIDGRPIFIDSKDLHST
jgi:predicted amidohydrolase YtcJ